MGKFTKIHEATKTIQQIDPLQSCPLFGKLSLQNSANSKGQFAEKNSANCP